MTETEHYKLKKPGENDYADIEVLNGNMDVLDEVLKETAGRESEAPLRSAGLKETPADADSLALVDSADGNKTKRVLWSRVKALLSGLYAAVGHKHAAGDVTSGTLGVARGGTGGSTAETARKGIGACAQFAPVTITVPAANWAGSGPWTQTVSVAGVTADMTGVGLYMVDVADAAARKLYETAYGCLAAEFDTVAGGVELTCRDKKPATNFQAQLGGVKP